VAVAAIWISWKVPLWNLRQLFDNCSTVVYPGDDVAPDETFVHDATFLVCAKEKGARQDVQLWVRIIEVLDTTDLAPDVLGHGQKHRFCKRQAVDDKRSLRLRRAEELGFARSVALLHVFCKPVPKRQLTKPS